jgi:outer membrane protein assembly factor BamB
VQALWEAPLIEARVVGKLVVGLLAGEGPVHELRAVSELTGQTAWSAPVPAGYPDVLGLITGDGLVLVEVGHSVGRAPAAVIPVVTRDVVFDAANGRELWSAPVEKSAAARLQHQPVALSRDLLITGDAAGGLTARAARSGTTVWTQARPASCPQTRGSEQSYDDGVNRSRVEPLRAAS